MPARVAAAYDTDAGTEPDTVTGTEAGTVAGAGPAAG